MLIFLSHNSSVFFFISSNISACSFSFNSPPLIIPFPPFILDIKTPSSLKNFACFTFLTSFSDCDLFKFCSVSSLSFDGSPGSDVVDVNVLSFSSVASSFFSPVCGREPGVVSCDFASASAFACACAFSCSYVGGFGGASSFFSSVCGIEPGVVSSSFASGPFASSGTLSVLPWCEGRDVSVKFFSSGVCCIYGFASDCGVSDDFFIPS